MGQLKNALTESYFELTEDNELNKNHVGFVEDEKKIIPYGGSTHLQCPEQPRQLCHIRSNQPHQLNNDKLQARGTTQGETIPKKSAHRPTEKILCGATETQ